MIFVGTKIIIGLLLLYIILNVFYQICFEDTNWKVRRMKHLLNSLEPKNKQISPFSVSPSPYTNALHERWNNGQWVKELSNRIYKDLEEGLGVFDLFLSFNPFNKITHLANKATTITDTIYGTMDSIYREIGNNCNVYYPL
jgi:hypothetical protein